MEINRQLKLEDTVPSALDRAGKRGPDESDDEPEDSSEEEPKAKPEPKKKKKKKRKTKQTVTRAPSGAGASPKPDPNELPTSQRSFIGLAEDKQQELLRKISSWSGLSTTAGNGQLNNARMLASLAPKPAKVWDEMVSNDLEKLESLPDKPKHDPPTPGPKLKTTA